MGAAVALKVEPVRTKPSKAGKVGGLSDAALDVLRHHIEINDAERSVKITAALSPSLYQEVAACFTRYGARYMGKRDSGTGRHVWPFDPRPMIESIIQYGEVNALDFYPTPRQVAEELLDMVPWGVSPAGLRVLEPSAGAGGIVDALLDRAKEEGPYSLHITAIERNTALARLLTDKCGGRYYGEYSALAEWEPEAVKHFQATDTGRVDVVHADFLTWEGEGDGFDVVLMNPPFNGDGGRDSYIAHIWRAWKMLKPGGLLVSVVPMGWTWAVPSDISE